MKHMRMPRSGKTLLAVSLVSVAAIGATIIATSTSTNAQQSEQSQSENTPEAPPATMVAMTLGVTPESAAVANLNGAALDAVFGFCDAHAEETTDCMEYDGLIEGSQQYLASIKHEDRKSVV